MPGPGREVFEDLDLGVLRGAPLPTKKPSRRPMALAAAAVPTKATIFPPWGRSTLGRLGRDLARLAVDGADYARCASVWPSESMAITILPDF